MNFIRRVALIHIVISLLCALHGSEASSMKEMDTTTNEKKSSRTGLRGVDDKMVGAETESNDIERVDLSIAPPPCADTPRGWNDNGGAQYNCAWYSETSERCSFYGHLFANKGLTANEVCCICGGGTSGHSSVPPNGGGFNGQSYEIITSRYNDDCMSVNSADDNNVVIWHCTIGNYQKWYLDNTKIKNMKEDGLCLDWNQDSDNVTMQICNGRSNQDWFTEFADSGVIFRVSSPNGPCLTLELNGGGTNLKVEKCRDTVNKKFDIIIYN